jgi:hypothetical protein
MLAAKRIREQADGITIRLATISCRTRQTLSAGWKRCIRVTVREMARIRKFSGAAIVLIVRFVFVTGKQEQGFENFL